jgi:hypothetical protein
MNPAYFQAEQDIEALRLVLIDLFEDWRTPDGHRGLIDNGHRLETELDNLSLLVEKIRASSTSRVVRSIPINIQAAE